MWTMYNSKWETWLTHKPEVRLAVLFQFRPWSDVLQLSIGVCSKFMTIGLVVKMCVHAVLRSIHHIKKEILQVFIEALASIPIYTSDDILRHARLPPSPSPVSPFVGSRVQSRLPATCKCGCIRHPRTQKFRFNLRAPFNVRGGNICSQLSGISYRSDLFTQKLCWLCFGFILCLNLFAKRQAIVHIKRCPCINGRNNNLDAPENTKSVSLCTFAWHYLPLVHVFAQAVTETT